MIQLAGKEVVDPELTTVPPFAWTAVGAPPDATTCTGVDMLPWIPCMADAGTLTSCAVDTLPPSVVTRTVVPPSEAMLYGTLLGMT